MGDSGARREISLIRAFAPGPRVLNDREILAAGSYGTCIKNQKTLTHLPDMQINCDKGNSQLSCRFCGVWWSI